MMRSAAITGLIGAILIAVVGAIWLWPPGNTHQPPRAVVLISIDTTRADRLHCYGYPVETTPNIDALAAESTLFEHVISPVPTTLPAHSSMLTGTIPPYHGVHANLGYRLRDPDVTLAEVMRDGGYSTAGVVGAFVLDPQFGIAQGFDTYDARFNRTPAEPLLSERRADAVNAAAFDWLERNHDERFFLFIHYYDPHFPYEAPEPYRSRFADPYDAEIAWTDAHIGALIDRLKALGAYDDAMIVLTSDHGEGLGDHGESQHGYFVYHSTTRVPLLVKWPGRNERSRVAHKVGLIDIMPTVLAAAGLKAPPAVQGQNLRPLAEGAKDEGVPRALFAESLTATRYGCSSLLALEVERWKYIQTAEPELYDLTADPQETNNVIGQYPTEATRLRGWLRSLLDESLRVADEAVAMDPEALARLESLGYVGGRIDASFDFASDREDPKTFLPIFEKITEANYLLRHGRWGGARSLCTQILERRQDIPKVYETIGRIAFEQQQYEEAADHYLNWIRLSPDSPEAYNALGNVRVRQGRMDEAVMHYREALRLAGTGGDRDDTIDDAFVRLARVSPILFQARLNLANVLFYQRRFDDAAIEYTHLLQMDPISEGPDQRELQLSKIRFQHGVALAMLGRYEDAIESLEESLRLRPDFEPAERALTAARAGRPPSP